MADNTIIQGTANFLATPKGQAFLKTVHQTALNVAKLSLAQRNFFYSELRDYLNTAGNTPRATAPTQGQFNQQITGTIIKPAPSAGGGGGGNGVDAIPLDPSKIKFNLPPHVRSLPLNTAALDSTNSGHTYVGTNHGLRRAKLWFAFDATTPTSTNLVLDTSSASTSTGTTAIGTNYVLTADQSYWGFQFLWNPQNIQVGVSRNANFTPSSIDSMAALYGQFTAMETVQFTIVIDRINDFAAAAAASSGLNMVAALNYNDYTPGGFIGATQNPQLLLQDLLKKGTLHDLEYLFRAINGSGNGSDSNKTWHNSLGRETADIGFLSPNAIALQLGPDATNNLSYIGWVDSLAINHSVFNKNMIPLHTEVVVSFNVFSRVALTSNVSKSTTK
jgi:hypothetical protein